MVYLRARYSLALAALLLLTRCDHKAPPATAAKQPAAAHSHGDSREPATHSDSPGGRSLSETVADLRDDLTNWSALENPDHIFQDLLEIYHERALEMADQEISRGTDAHLRQLADSIRRRTLGSQAQLEIVHKRLHRPGADYRSTSPQQSRIMLSALEKGQRILSTPIEASTLDQQYVAYMDLYYQSGLLLARTQIRHGREAPRVALAKEWETTLQREWETIKEHRPGQMAEHP
jgi:uncharacterized protein (DUF305 family)